MVLVRVDGDFCVCSFSVLIYLPKELPIKDIDAVKKVLVQCSAILGILHHAVHNVHDKLGISVVEKCNLVKSLHQLLSSVML